MDTYAREQAVDIDDVLAATEAHYRATVEVEIVAWLRREAGGAAGSQFANESTVLAHAAYMIERGAHRAAEARTTPRG
jgi:hypothetical protein